MSDQTPTYSIISRNHVSKWNGQLQRAEQGWELVARWEATGTLLPVFVPDDRYTPDQVDAAIRALGAKDDAIHKLGA